MTRTLVRQSQKRFQVSGDDSIVLMQLDRLGEVSFPDPDLNEAAAAADAPRGLALKLVSSRILKFEMAMGGNPPTEFAPIEEKKKKKWRE